jgi:hypothetical protein
MTDKLYPSLSLYPTPLATHSVTGEALVRPSSTYEADIKKKFAEKAGTAVPNATTPVQLPGLQEAKITPQGHWVGSTRTAKKGFCGTSVVNSSLDIFANEKGQLVMHHGAPGDSGKRDDPFTGRFKEIQCRLTDEIVAYQKTPEGKKTLGKDMENLVIPPAGGSWKWLMGFKKPLAKEGTIEYSYFFFKDDNDLEKFKNTVMGSTNLGRQFLGEVEGGAGAVKHIIARRKAQLGDQLLSAIERAYARKHNPQLPASNVQKIEPNVQTSQVAAQPPAQLTNSQNVGAKSLEGSSFTKLTKIIDIPKNIPVVKRSEIDHDEQSFVLTPRKFYNLVTLPGVKDDPRAYHLFDLVLVVGPAVLTDDQLASGSFPNSDSVNLELIPLPIASTSIQTTEYAVVCSRGSLDLTNFIGNILTVFVQNKEEKGKIVCSGRFKIADTKDAFIAVEMLQSKGRYGKEFDKPFGTVIFKREHSKTPIPSHPAFTDLTSPASFGGMKILQNTILKDYGLTSLSEPQGAGRKYAKIRKFLASEWNFCNRLAAFENQGIRLNEWYNYERLVKINNGLILQRLNGQAGEIAITNGESYKSVARYAFGSHLLFSSFDHSSDAFTFFSRDHWKDSQEFSGIRDHTEKALITGMPDYLYIPVWKSLGKFSFVGEIISQLCRVKLPNFKDNHSLLAQLAEAGKDELYHNPSLEKDLAAMDKAYFFPAGQYATIRACLCAFLKLNLIMEDVSDEVNLKGPILKGFSLKTVGGLCHIIRHLVTLQAACVANLSKDPRCRGTTEDDVFLILMSICFIFVPEHFLNPLFNFTPDQDCLNFYNELKVYGLELEKLQKNKMFISSSAVGSYKLSLIIAQCIKRECQDVFDHMTNLGFPFLNYCLDLSESLFSEYLNQDVLSKVWNAIFFEGADKVKRRAQHIILSTIVVIVKNCRKEILGSKSSAEILWHLKARGEFSFESTQLISDVFKYRNMYFVSKAQSSDGGLLSVFTSQYKGGPKSIEEEFKTIKQLINNDFDNVAAVNNRFFTYLLDTVKRMEKNGQKLDLAYLQEFAQGLVLVPSADKKINLNFENSITKSSVLISQKPIPDNIKFSIASSDFGNLNPENVVVTVQTNFKTQGFSMRSADASWYKTHTFDTKAIENGVHHAWIEVKVEGIDRIGKAFNHSVKYTLDRVKYNKNNFFLFHYSTFWMNLCLNMTSAEVKTDTSDYFSKLDHDIQNSDQILTENLAKELSIKKEMPYLEELLNNTCDVQKLEHIFGSAYKSSGLRFNDDMLANVVGKDILGIGKSNLFETLVRIIMFSPISNKASVDQLFVLLSRLDLSPDPHKVKRTHVEFLIWFILRLTQIYLPYSEVVSIVSEILGHGNSYVISAILTDQENPRNPSLDISELLNLWFVAQKRKTGSPTITLGKNGKLTELATAIKFLQKEGKLQEYKFAKVNKLRVYINCSGESKKIDIKFDQNMNQILDNKSITSIETPTVLALYDSEESLSLSKFTEVISRVQILDWIFSRLTGIGGESKIQHQFRDLMVSEFKQSEELEVVTKFRYNSAAKEHVVGVVRLTKRREVNTLDQKRDTPRLNYIIDNKRQLQYGTGYPEITDVKILEDNLSMKVIIEEAFQELQTALIQGGDPKKGIYRYAADTVDILGATFENMTIFVEGRQLNPEYFDVTLKSISERIGNLKKIHVLVEFQRADIKPVYNHWARDIFYLEGVDVVDNPFVPCQIVAADDIFAQVLFSGDSGNPLLLRSTYCSS